MVVSSVNGCEYCINAHTTMLKQLGATDKEICEAVSVADLYNGFNAFAEGVQIESDIKP